MVCFLYKSRRVTVSGGLSRRGGAVAKASLNKAFMSLIVDLKPSELSMDRTKQRRLRAVVEV